MNKNYRGFDLGSVSWGYRDIFSRLIDKLFQENLLGEKNEDATSVFFSLMKKADDNKCFDHVLKHFLEALNSGSSWIMKLPALFSDWCDLGALFSENKMYMGLQYFELWGKGGFGVTPQEVTYALNKARKLLSVNREFAYAFLKGYAGLLRYLSPSEIDSFVENAQILFQRSPKAALGFLELKTKTARIYIRSISSQARLSDNSAKLVLLGRSLCGREFKVSDLGSLDSDDIIEHGTFLATTLYSLFLPARVNVFKKASENRAYYRMITVLAASCYLFKSFSLSHGLDFSSSAECMSASIGINYHRLFLACEAYRVLFSACRNFPGIKNDFNKILQEEKRNSRLPPDLYPLLVSALQGTRPKEPALRLARDAAGGSDFVQTLMNISAMLKDEKAKKILDGYFRPAAFTLPFFPDFTFPVNPGTPPPSVNRMDLRDLQKNPEKEKPEAEAEPETAGGENNEEPDNAEKIPGKDISEKCSAGYFYDEWNEHEKEYYEKWCRVTEKKIFPADSELYREACIYAAWVRRVFERLKPDLSRKEKYLANGDNINIDELLRFIVQQKSGETEQEKFYEKPRIKKRDLAVSLLLDASGSTGEECPGGKRVIDLEKEAAFVLAEGLHDLGDKFSLYGFSGSGREHAEFYIYKDFQDEWNSDTQKALWAAQCASSTRMGAAIRHAGYKLSQAGTRKKLLIIITDGKPMDADYDPQTRYAQFDVARAGEENRRLGIDSFCISTEENKLEELEIMFPLQKFVIIKSMLDLPRVLSLLYLKLTR